MINKIKQRIEILSARAEQLVQEREEASIRIDQINTEIAQIVGAIQEMDSLLRENEEHIEKEKPQDESRG